MDDEIKTWLFDIKMAIIEIESFFEEGSQHAASKCHT